MLDSTSNRTQGRGMTTVPTMVSAPSSTPTTITSSRSNSANHNNNSNNNNNNNNNNINNSYGISAAMAEAGVSDKDINNMVKYGNKMVDQFHERERVSASHREFSDTIYTVNPGQTAYLRPGFVIDELSNDNERPSIKASYDAFTRLRVQEHAIDSILEKTRGVQHNAYLDYNELFMSLKSAPAKTLKVIIKSRILSQTSEMSFKTAVSIEAQLFSSFASEFSGSSSLPSQTPSFVKRLDLARVFRRILIASEHGVSEWTNTTRRNGRIGAFVFQADLSNEQVIKIILELNQSPRVYKLNNQLAQLAHGPTATLQSVVSLLWDYGTEYKLFEFNPATAVLTLTCDEYLSTVFNYPIGEKIVWRGIEKHILPTLTEQPPLMISIPIMFSVPENMVSFVVPLMYDNHNELINSNNNSKKKNKIKNKNLNDCGYYGIDSSGGVNENVGGENNGMVSENGNNNNNVVDGTVPDPESIPSTDIVTDPTAAVAVATAEATAVTENTNANINNSGDVFMSECMNNNNNNLNCNNDGDDDDDDDDCEDDEFDDYYGIDENRMKGNNGDDGLSSLPRIETVADATRYFKSHKISPFDTSEDNSVASSQIKDLDDRLDKIFAEIRERVARRKLYLEFARKPSVAAAKVTTALLRDRGIVAAKISGHNPDEIRKSSFYKSHSPYMNHAVKTYFTIPMEKKRHKN